MLSRFIMRLGVAAAALLWAPFHVVPVLTAPGDKLYVQKPRVNIAPGAFAPG